MPRAACTRVAVAGKVSSGVAVARTIRSRSEALMPAWASALSDALMARCEVNSPSAAMWRCLMPVRCWIHSSDDFLGQFVVADDPFRQVGAAPLNDGPYHSPPPLACSAGVVGASAVEITWCSLPRPSTSLFLYS